ncbi:hypothetical protein B9G53_02475 [Pseudanabaena sp. SR411]|uniref:hypothetical protein n=1 Tax=Pseudanabaena sp. SR411 TaxID=1980935 RepID=UPI000B995905|nr:hypothetical protein [Pseudanabaena sp. SR411]OYQ67235.1 hypothetical protein B9G53_02475 [Pseudanabaena sp. SR411]
MYSYTAIFSLSSQNHLWFQCFIRDILLDDENPVEFFKTEKYQLLATRNFIFYKSDHEEEVNNKHFETEAINVIVKALKRLEFAYVALDENLIWHTTDIMNKYGYLTHIKISNHANQDESIDSLDIFGNASSGISFPNSNITLSFDKINKILEVVENNLDEYIDRFLSLKKSSVDPVLHLMNLYSLYEYISEINASIKSLFNKEIEGKSIEQNGNIKKITFSKKFKNARNFVAHGSLHGIETLLVLKQFLPSDSGGNSLSFSRYNSEHINLLNEVIHESQFLILKYLKETVGISE